MGLDEAEAHPGDGELDRRRDDVGVVAGLAEPTCANQITVDGEVAVFEPVRNLRFIIGSANRWCGHGAATGTATARETWRRWK